MRHDELGLTAGLLPNARLAVAAARPGLEVVTYGRSPSAQVRVGDVRPDWVFHLAAHGAYPWQVDHREMLATNLVATTHLVDACRGAAETSLRSKNAQREARDP